MVGALGIHPLYGQAHGVATAFLSSAAHAAYNGIMLLGLFLAFPILAATAVTSEKRRLTFRQRLGWWRYAWEDAARRRGRGVLWVHALSVGEVIAVQPLILRLSSREFGPRIVLTISTHGGYQAAQKLFHPAEVDLAYFPYDFIWSVRIIANKIKPSAVILTETDFWPNFIAEMARRRVPISIVNLRLSSRSWKWMYRFKPLVRQALKRIDKICVQTDRDARRLIDLGMAQNHIAVAGNFKFDSPRPHMQEDATRVLKEHLSRGPERKIVVAGSTHRGEESALLDAMEIMLNNGTPVFLIVAPRRPERAGEVLGICRERRLPCARLTDFNNAETLSDVQVVVVDKIGYLKSLYGLGDVAYIGGSLVPRGGHNPLEPAAFGKPVLFGPDMSDFKQISDMLVNAGAAQRVNNARQFRMACTALLNDKALRHRMGTRAQTLLAYHRGAVDRALGFLGLMDGCTYPGEQRRAGARTAHVRIRCR